MTLIGISNSRFQIPVSESPEPAETLTGVGTLELAIKGDAIKSSVRYRKKVEEERMAALNTARVGKFSSDRSIGDYARNIWGISPIG